MPTKKSHSTKPSALKTAFLTSAHNVLIKQGWSKKEADLYTSKEQPEGKDPELAVSYALHTAKLKIPFITLRVQGANYGTVFLSGSSEIPVKVTFKGKEISEQEFNSIRTLISFFPPTKLPYSPTEFPGLTISEVSESTFPGRILIQHGKHGETYYYVPTFTALLQAAKTIFAQNDEIGFYNYYSKAAAAPTTPLTPLSVTEKLDPALHTANKQAWDNYNGQLRANQVHQGQVDLYTRAKSGDGRAILRLLTSRDSGEYERLTIEQAQIPTT